MWGVTGTIEKMYRAKNIFKKKYQSKNVYSDK